MPFGFHGLDLVVILVIALLIFGPKKLPEMGSAIGKSIQEFRKGMSELTAPKDEHAEEDKLPVSATNEIGKPNATVVETETPLNATAVETDAPLKTTTAASEVKSSEVKID